MTKREGLCIGGPWAGSFRSALTARIEFRVQVPPEESHMFKLGAYVHHDIAIGDTRLKFWALEFASIAEIFEELSEGYWKYHELSR